MVNKIINAPKNEDVISKINEIIDNALFSIPNSYLQNLSSNPQLTILGSSHSGQQSINIGASSSINGSQSTVLGTVSSSNSNNGVALGYNSANNTGNYCVAVGSDSKTAAQSNIQIGYGTNLTANSLSIGFYNNSNTHYNWQLLDGTTGLVPDARISSNIARAADIPTVPTNISAFNNDSGYITGITSSDVTTALGYTPENSANKVTSISSSSTDTEYPSAKAVIELLKVIYPVGSLYITSSNDVTCPIASLFGTWTLVAKDYALWTGDGTNGNDTIAAGLPDVNAYYTTGNFSADSGNVSGAISRDSNLNNKNRTTSSGSNFGAVGYFFNASDSNSIYGSSLTVQPPSYVVNVWRRTA